MWILGGHSSVHNTGGGVAKKLYGQKVRWDTELLQFILLFYPKALGPPAPGLIKTMLLCVSSELDTVPVATAPPCPTAPGPY